MDYHKELTKAKIMLEAADPMNPEISVPGLGTYDLVTLKANVLRQAKNLVAELEGNQPQSYINAKHTLDGGSFQIKIESIVAAYEDLQALRRKGGLRSRGIDKF